MTFHFVTTAQSIDDFSINPTGSHLEGGSISINFNISWVSKIDYENDFVITDFLLPIDLSLIDTSKIQTGMYIMTITSIDSTQINYKIVKLRIL